MILRILHADDEPLARLRVADLLAEVADVELVAACEDGEEAVGAIVAARPDVVLLDVQMPGLTGFEVVEALAGEEMPVVIFVTAYNEFAVRAFDAHAVDYLLKPLAPARFNEAIERARAQVLQRRRGEGMPDLTALLEAIADRQGYPERIVVRLGHRLILVPVQTIDWIGAEGNYARLHAGKQGHLVRDTMAGLERRLDPAVFLRIHRSTIVNTRRVREIQTLSSRTFVLILEDGTRLESSGGYRRSIQQWIDGAPLGPGGAPRLSALQPRA